MTATSARPSGALGYGATMITVVATLVSQADKVDDTQAALSALVAPTRAENGCISYELFQSDDDPTEFVTVEEWSDDEAMAAHLASEHIAAALAAAPDILAADPKITKLNPVA